MDGLGGTGGGESEDGAQGQRGECIDRKTRSLPAGLVSSGTILIPLPSLAKFPTCKTRAQAPTSR